MEFGIRTIENKDSKPRLEPKFEGIGRIIASAVSNDPIRLHYDLDDIKKLISQEGENYRLQGGDYSYLIVGYEKTESYLYYDWYEEDGLSVPEIFMGYMETKNLVCIMELYSSKLNVL